MDINGDKNVPKMAKMQRNVAKSFSIPVIIKFFNSYQIWDKIPGNYSNLLDEQGHFMIEKVGVDDDLLLNGFKQ